MGDQEEMDSTPSMTPNRSGNQQEELLIMTEDIASEKNLSVEKTVDDNISNTAQLIVFDDHSNGVVTENTSGEISTAPESTNGDRDHPVGNEGMTNGLEEIPSTTAADDPPDVLLDLGNSDAQTDAIEETGKESEANGSPGDQDLLELHVKAKETGDSKDPAVEQPAKTKTEGETRLDIDFMASNQVGKSQETVANVNADPANDELIPTLETGPTIENEAEERLDNDFMAPDPANTSVVSDTPENEPQCAGEKAEMIVENEIEHSPDSSIEEVGSNPDGEEEVSALLPDLPNVEEENFKSHSDEGVVVQSVEEGVTEEGQEHENKQDTPEEEKIMPSHTDIANAENGIGTEAEANLIDVKEPVSDSLPTTSVQGTEVSPSADLSSVEADTDTEQSLIQETTVIPMPSPSQTNSTPLLAQVPNLLDDNDKNESIFTELQENLQHQMTVRAEVEDKLRKQAAELDSYKKKFEEYSEMEDKLEQMSANLTQVVAEKTQLEQEVNKLRDGRDDLERKEAVLSNRLNDAKKKEATKSNVAGKLERENEELKEGLEGAKVELKTVTAQKQKLEHSMEKLKKKCVERVKMAEAALIEERNLNEERKKKMKFFVETKAEELRSAKSGNDELRAELKETSGALRSVRGKLEHMASQFENASTKNRELTREMNRMKKNSEQLHQLGGNLELELQKSAQETEEHKNKRLTAKHELMTMLRKLEAEQAVSGKLRDSVKFTFTPKAMSQQQLLDESLKDFESELLKLSRRLGKPLPPSTQPDVQNYGEESESHGSADGPNVQGVENGKKKANSRSEWDTARLLSSLEHETQQVSKGIMAFSQAVERLNSLLDTSGEKTCANTLNEIFGALAAARADASTIPGGAGQPINAEEFSSYEDEDGSFAGSPVESRSSKKYGVVNQEM